MIFYKKLNADGSLNMIGTQDELPTDAVEINATEYKELYQYIQEHAVNEIEEVAEETIE